MQRQTGVIQKGFTLVELVVVIAVLGILAASALPRFINVNKQAREAAVGGIAGGLRSAVGMVQAAYMTAGGTGTTVTMVDGTAVTVTANSGLPTGTAAGIGAAAKLSADVTVAYGASSTFRPVGGSATCQASYDSANGDVRTDLGGC